jgi:hypothetical protein
MFVPIQNCNRIMMKNIYALTVILAASVALSGCQFQNKSNVLLPTAPSSSTSTSSNSSSSSSSSSSTTNNAASAAAGTWASPIIAGVPNISNCTNLQWQISNLSATSLAGSVSAVCGGVVNVSADLTGQMSGSDVVNLTASGQAVGLGITCPFSLTGVGHLQGNDAMQLNYQGTTCLGPVSGSQMLQRRAPEPAPSPSSPAPTPDPTPEPQPPPADDGAFGCSGIGDHYQLVLCIHGHVNPHNEYEAFEVTKRVAWALRGEGAGLLIKTTGENIVPWRGYVFAAGRICYPDGHIFKVISDVGAGGANGPSWQDNGYVDRSNYLPALDTTY